jgi:hypothetical protein
MMGPAKIDNNLMILKWLGAALYGVSSVWPLCESRSSSKL